MTCFFSTCIFPSHSWPIYGCGLPILPVEVFNSSFLLRKCTNSQKESRLSEKKTLILWNILLRVVLNFRGVLGFLVFWTSFVVLLFCCESEVACRLNKDRSVMPEELPILGEPPKYRQFFEKKFKLARVDLWFVFFFFCSSRLLTYLRNIDLIGVVSPTTIAAQSQEIASQTSSQTSSTTSTLDSPPIRPIQDISDECYLNALGPWNVLCFFFAFHTWKTRRH